MPHHPTRPATRRRPRGAPALPGGDREDELMGLVAGLQAAWNAHDIEGVTAFYAPEYVGTDVGEAAVQQGRIELRKTVRRTFEAFPDLELIIEETIVQGDRIVLVWEMRGTHRGSFLRIPPTGRLVTMRGMSRLTVADGLIASGVRIWDLAGLLRCVGLLPDL